MDGKRMACPVLSREDGRTFNLDLPNISRRTLHYYNEIGLLHPAKVECNSYRFYDDAALMKLQKIMLLKAFRGLFKRVNQCLQACHSSRYTR
ncbi:MerR family transcriptional regulator [Paenibacillus thiaminolyticus]|uniref:MerR family transcriptional regulator n=1 Tax=Paenibacillus thiaminolyticus TaxID=49283 RepID=UPI0035A67757